jgi:hypothetical protein
MSKQGKTVNDLRDMLFSVMEGVRDKSIPIDKAKTISELAQVVVNTAKVEADFLKTMGGKAVGTGFLGHQQLPALPVPEAVDAKPSVPAPEKKDGELPAGIAGITQHRIADKE